MRALAIIGSLACCIVTAAVAQTAHVARAALFAGESRSIPPQTRFRADTPAIELRVLARDVKRGSTVSSSWITETADGVEPNYEIRRLTMPFDDERAKTAIFTLSRPNAGWPVGRYRVDLRFNDGPVEFSERFVIVDKDPA